MCGCRVAILFVFSHFEKCVFSIYAARTKMNQTMGPALPDASHRCRSGAGVAVFLVLLLSVLGSVFHLLFLYCFSTVSTVNSRFFCFFTCTFFFTHLALPEAEPTYAKSKKCVTVKTLETSQKASLK